MRRFLIALLTKCHPDDRSKKSEVGRARGTYRKSRGAYRILMDNLEGKT
jgi:mRNA-degrading endonuclease RelE of RelBE toxin-antitoxin system